MFSDWVKIEQICMLLSNLPGSQKRTFRTNICSILSSKLARNSLQIQLNILVQKVNNTVFKITQIQGVAVFTNRDVAE